MCFTTLKYCKSAITQFKPRHSSMCLGLNTSSVASYLFAKCVSGFYPEGSSLLLLVELMQM